MSGRHAARGSQWISGNATWVSYGNHLFRGCQEHPTARNPEAFAHESGLPRAIADVLNHSVAEDKVEGIVPEGKVTAVASNRLNLRMDLPESTHRID